MNKTIHVPFILDVLGKAGLVNEHYYKYLPNAKDQSL